MIFFLCVQIYKAETFSKGDYIITTFLQWYNMNERATKKHFEYTFRIFV